MLYTIFNVSVFNVIVDELAHLCREVCVGKRIQELIECLLIKFIVFGFLDFLWTSHLHEATEFKYLFSLLESIDHMQLVLAEFHLSHEMFASSLIWH